ncbi:PPE domain-containing protein, partial [Mycobacterium paragordonae]|uniref:PPE domain-containing protein n=1 Tax=Mycobacterium paragordonae TaxID=1389713 RepID=UPI0039882099
MVSVYEAARSMIVHPAVISGNRNSFVSLVLSNIFGQNAPAIAAAEAVYEEFWAQDIAAMLSYHGGASAAAAALTPFTKLPLGQLAGAGGVLSAAVSQLSGLAGAGGGNVKAVLAGLSSGNLGGLKLGSLLGGLNLGGVLGGLRLATGNFVNLNLHNLSGFGTGATAAAGHWGRHSFGSWGHFGGSNVQSLVTGLPTGGLGSVLSSGVLSSVIGTGGLSGLLSSPVVSGLLSSPPVSSLLSGRSLSSLLSSKSVSSLLSSLNLSTGDVSAALTQLGVGTGGPSAAAALSTPWGNFSLNQITNYVNSHGGLQAVLTNLSNSSAFTAWVDSGALASQLSGSGVTALLSSPAVSAVLSSPAVGAVLSSPLVSAVLS